MRLATCSTKFGTPANDLRIGRESFPQEQAAVDFKWPPPHVEQILKPYGEKRMRAPQISETCVAIFSFI
ncbi:hypothetical protein Naga_100113g8 [Nannochloropsis gaditana]|uniref:Uncharacterized protein n=1 Tax=Nannochloropsis gaditana TaxID=72520 RepID=W7TA56_9STRA|nr:hypothetical protein Naga_100113g8 [Nannochloropsis gaditana]